MSALYILCVDRKHLENKAFQKGWCHDNHVAALNLLSSSDIYLHVKWPVIVVYLIQRDMSVW